MPIHGLNPLGMVHVAICVNAINAHLVAISLPCIQRRQIAAFVGNILANAAGRGFAKRDVFRPIAAPPCQGQRCSAVIANLKRPNARCIQPCAKVWVCQILRPNLAALSDGPDPPACQNQTQCLLGCFTATHPMFCQFLCQTPKRGRARQAGAICALRDSGLQLALYPQRAEPKTKRYSLKTPPSRHRLDSKRYSPFCHPHCGPRAFGNARRMGGEDNPALAQCVRI